MDVDPVGSCVVSPLQVVTHKLGPRPPLSVPRYPVPGAPRGGGGGGGVVVVHYWQWDVTASCLGEHAFSVLIDGGGEF